MRISFQFGSVGAALLMFAFASSARAETTGGAPKAAPKSAPIPAAIEEQLVEGISCKNGQETRRLEVHTKDAGCVLQYFKAGKVSQIAMARHSVDLCKDNLRKVRSTLEGAGYRCE